jgi:hypothetical protein
MFEGYGITGLRISVMKILGYRTGPLNVATIGVFVLFS